MKPGIATSMSRPPADRDFRTRGIDDILACGMLRGRSCFTEPMFERVIGPALFGDPLLASAAMDRLLHGAHVVTLDGDSYRNPPPERGRKATRTAHRSAS